MKKITKPIYVFDIETDPFEHGADIQPFACGLYGENIGFKHTWGNECIVEMKQVLNEVPSGVVYAHNGGKFDMYYCMNWFVNMTDAMFINNRLVRAEIARGNRRDSHEFRDSYAIMPFALKRYKKDVIDYRTFTKTERRKNKDEIIKYLQGDCEYLHELCVSFNNRFGDNLTIGSTSMKELKKLHEFERLDEREDMMIRGDHKNGIQGYYYGGRVQCFERGVVKPSNGEQIVAYDLNQCYPYVMSEMKHPVCKPKCVVGNEITSDTYFVTVNGRNHGAFPIRDVDGSLRFNKKRGTFSVSIHEYNAAIETGLFEVEDVVACIDFEHATSFKEFVSKFHKLRKQAQELNTEDGKRDALFFKYVGNSAYGKFAQNPNEFYSYKITDLYTDLNPMNIEESWQPCHVNLINGYKLWKVKAVKQFRYNVATGASITGAARSLLIRALAVAQRPIYCDTDSIVCERLNGALVDATRIGYWKIEATGNRMAIGGRKLYALFSERCPQCNGERKQYVGKCKNEDDRHTWHETGCCKDASKGAILSPSEILKVAQGETVTWIKKNPTINVKNHTMKYMARDVQMTMTDMLNDCEEYGE